MIGLPPPTTFAEGQRALFGWLIAAAGVFCGLISVTMVALLVWGGWSAEHERLIIIIFGCSLGAFILAMVVVIISLALGGPVGRFKVSASKEGASVEAESD